MPCFTSIRGGSWCYLYRIRLAPDSHQSLENTGQTEVDGGKSDIVAFSVALLLMDQPRSILTGIEARLLPVNAAKDPAISTFATSALDAATSTES